MEPDAQIIKVIAEILQVLDTNNVNERDSILIFYGCLIEALANSPLTIEKSDVFFEDMRNEFLIVKKENEEKKDF